MEQSVSKFHIREISGSENFDVSLLCDSTPLTQSAFYGSWQNISSYKTKRLVVDESGVAVAFMQLIVFPLLFGKSYIYIPYGPVTKNLTEDLLLFLKSELEKIAVGERAVFVRYDFTPSIGHSENIIFISKNLTKASIYTNVGAHIQPRSEWYLDLQKPEEQILKEMHEKTRYSVRLAERKNVKVEIVTSGFGEYFETFHDLMCANASRNNFHIHDRAYYEAVFESLNSEKAYLSVSRFENKILSIYVVIHYGNVANYIFGCSGDEHRELAPTYLAHWRAICYSKQLGAIAYNFGAVTSEGGHKKMAIDSLTIFKKKFGGYAVVHSDLYDQVLNSFWYYLYIFRKYIKTIIK